ncbi:MAG: hypothetical protein GF346_02875 [Candidatus Eisenbacteria bacterium]|nr:hypothetical protein [Candidatus Latescibacterota bacterium]MBD3301364.1 hypothetical protein [Candidatus Eisenbacteria bacterium]
MRKSGWPRGPGRIEWIVDGHNVIFAHPLLETLQRGGERREARRRLEAMLERLIARTRNRILVVYDGNRIERDPDARRGRSLRTQYSDPPEEADDRILRVTARLLRREPEVVAAVVTNDRALVERLPERVVWTTPRAVFTRLRRRTRSGEPGRERPPGDFSDIEAYFLSLDRNRPRRPTG